MHPELSADPEAGLKPATPVLFLQLASKSVSFWVLCKCQSFGCLAVWMFVLTTCEVAREGNSQLHWGVSLETGSLPWDHSWPQSGRTSVWGLNRRTASPSAQRPHYCPGPYEDQRTERPLLAHQHEHQLSQEVSHWSSSQACGAITDLVK